MNGGAGPVPAFKAQGSGQALLFLHGIGGNRDMFDPQLDAFAAAGWRAIAWDAPGYGESAAPARFDWAHLADAVAVLLDHLAVERVVLVGHSMGGMIAQEVAARHPARLRALVLSGTAPAFGRADGAWQKQFLAARLDPLDGGTSMAELAPALMRDLVAPGAAPSALAVATRAMSLVPPATYRAALHNLVTFDRRASLAAIAVPTLLIAGEADRTAPPAGMARMAERIPGSRYRLIAGAGHIANLERPVVFNALLREFLGDLPPA